MASLPAMSAVDFPDSWHRVILEARRENDMQPDDTGSLATAEPSKRWQTVFGSRMAYAEAGRGAPVVFLHGNPASSYIWRNIIPLVSPLARCVAPDLLGMGDSDKLDGEDPLRYGFLAQRRFLDRFLIELGLSENVVLVGQDWGGALALDWACRHPAQTRGVVYFETFVRPRTWNEMDPAVRHIFQRLRSPEGEEMVLRDNVFIENMFEDRILRPLSVAEMAVYRRPYLRPGEDRRPTLTLPRELAVDGEPAHMVRIIETYASALATSDIAKLFINGDPGAILVGELREFCRTWRNQREVTVRGKHFLQEDSPAEIGQAIAQWLAGLP
jgi:haloalkane dehalogenase